MTRSVISKQEDQRCNSSREKVPRDVPLANLGAKRADGLECIYRPVTSANTLNISMRCVLLTLNKTLSLSLSLSLFLSLFLSFSLSHGCNRPREKKSARLGSAWLASAAVPRGVVRPAKQSLSNGSRDNLSIYREEHRGRYPADRERVAAASPAHHVAIHSAFGFQCACRVGLRRGVARRVIEEVGVGCDHTTALLAGRARSIERKGKKSFRQTRIPEASSLQGSRINDLRAMIFRILPGEYS